MTWTHRIAYAVEHENAVADRLQSAGWDVCAFGQGQLSAGVRDSLRKHKTPLRWMPDLIAARDDAVYLIGAKTGRDDTANYDRNTEDEQGAKTDSQSCPVVIHPFHQDAT